MSDNIKTLAEIARPYPLPDKAARAVVTKDGYDPDEDVCIDLTTPVMGTDKTEAAHLRITRADVVKYFLLDHEDFRVFEAYQPNPRPEPQGAE